MAMQPLARRVTSTVALRLPAVAHLCAKHRVRRLGVFDSGATGELEAQKGSDLDFLAEFTPMSSEHAQTYLGMRKDLQRLLGAPVDLVEAGRSRNPYFQEAVRNTRMVLFEAA